MNEGLVFEDFLCDVVGDQTLLGQKMQAGGIFALFDSAAGVVSARYSRHVADNVAHYIVLHV